MLNLPVPGVQGQRGQVVRAALAVTDGGGEKQFELDFFRTWDQCYVTGSKVRCFRVLLVGAAGGFDWDAGQSAGPAEHVGTLRSLLDELRHSLKQISTIGQENTRFRRIP